jgi:hypothetical protein
LGIIKACIEGRVDMTKTPTISPVRKSSHPVRDALRDREWINERIDQFRGKWVMVYEGPLIAADGSIRGLLNQVPRQAIRRRL